MKGSLKRWVKILLIIAAIPLLVAGILYFILVNNLKDVLQYAIEKQSKGAYAFHSKDLKVSIWDRTITIDDIVLLRKDTVNALAYYDVKVPKAHLSIDSWQELIQHKRVSIDSLTIIKPEIAIHDYRVHEVKKNQTAFQTSMILDNLQKTLDHLHAKSIKMEDAFFSLYKRKGIAPVVVNNINLDVTNFLKIDNNDKHLFGSDKIELFLGRQHWVLADGKNTLSFTGLRFSSATQLFEIDSVVYRKPATAEQGETTLRADKFFFNSSHLPAVYQKGELLLDTLICIRPVLNLPLQTRKSQVKDTTGTVHSNIKSLFKQVNVRYTEIRDGEIVLAGQVNSPNAGTKKANLTIRNLNINPQKEHPLTTDSINLNLNNITFFSKDSLFKINVEQFSLVNDDVLFKNVVYGPASKKMTGKGMTFTAPALRLNNISLEDLMRKRLVASDAELVEPKITLIATRKAPSKPRVTANHDTVTHKKTDIYQTLHSFGDLLQVNQFRIINGNGEYKLVGNTKPVNATLKKLNATIQVKELLASDKLIKIKHAISDLRVHEMDVAANGLKIKLADYRMDGKERQNWVDKLQIDLANGTSLTANKIYWEAFSWDVLQQTKVIQIDLVRVHELLVDAKIKPKPASTEPVVATAKAPVKGLPKLRIGRLVAEHLDLKADLPKETLAGFEGQGVQVDKLSTDPKFLHWERFLGNLNNLYFKQSGGKDISVAQVALHSHEHTTLTNVHYGDKQAGKTMEVSVPKMQIKGPFPSTNFSTINLTTVQIERPELTMVTEAKEKLAGTGSGPAKAFSIPLNLALHDLKVNQAHVNLTTKKGDKATQVQTVVDVEATSLQAKKHEDATFASIRVSLSDVKLALPKLNVAVPSANVTLRDGKLSATKEGKPSLQAHLLASLTIKDLHPVLASKKGGAPPELQIKGINGDIDIPKFHWTAGQKMTWISFVEHANLAISDLSFKTATTNVKAEKVAWEHKNERLHLDNFQISPIMTKEEFMNPPHLQSDYITVQGERVEFNGLKADRWYKDSTLVVNHVVVKNIVTDVSRDKRLPDPAFSPNKLMPTQLISKIKVPFHIDSVSISNSSVLYHETSKMTNRVGTIPLKDINGTLKNITNRPKLTDSLKLLASTKLLGLHIKRVHYRESYGDSLSGFHMLLKTSDLHMRELTTITNPMAAADFDDGYLEPITARIAGNKYASVGNMRFHYRDLKLRLLGHKDSTRKSLLIKFENFAVAKVLRKKNDQDTRIFYDRDQKKFIFGYWIKSIMSGVLTSVGVKGNKKYHTNYLKLSQKHTLPAEE